MVCEWVVRKTALARSPTRKPLANRERTGRRTSDASPRKQTSTRSDSNRRFPALQAGAFAAWLRVRAASGGKPVTRVELVTTVLPNLRSGLPELHGRKNQNGKGRRNLRGSLKRTTRLERATQGWKPRVLPSTPRSRLAKGSEKRSTNNAPAGIEPTTCAFEAHRSPVPLSYRGSLSSERTARFELAASGMARPRSGLSELRSH